MNSIYWISMILLFVLLGGLLFFKRSKTGKFSLKLLIPIIIVLIPILLLSTLYIYYHIQLKPEVTISEIILQNEGFQIGHGTKSQPKTLNEYINQVAPLIGQFNRRTEDFWPQASFANSVIYFISNDKKYAWKVNYDGSYEAIADVKNVPRYGSILGYEMEFFPLYTETDGENGMVIIISKDALLDQEHYEKYTHLGTYDPLLTYIHEGFHVFVQDGEQWEAAEISKAYREDALDNFEARKLRTFTIELLYKALQDETNRDSYIKQAIKLYQIHRTTFSDEFERVRYFERIEGTAAYFEVISSLQVSYPNSINQTNYTDAVSLWTTNREATDYVGSSHEAYELGVLAGVLLDLSHGQKEWKLLIEKDPNITPMEQLEKIYTADELNQVETPVISDEFTNNLKNSINTGRDINNNLLKFLYNVFF